MANLGLITLASVSVVVISKLESLCSRKSQRAGRTIHSFLLLVFIAVTIGNFCTLFIKPECLFTTC